MLDRRLIQVPLGEGGTRYTVVITDFDTGDPETRRYRFIQELFTDGLFTGVLACGPVPFETLRMYRKDGRWVVELQATDLGQGGYG